MSDTSKTRTRRKIRKSKVGKERKKKLQKEGTTPKFPIQPEKSAEKGAAKKEK